MAGKLYAYEKKWSQNEPPSAELSLDIFRTQWGYSTLIGSDAGVHIYARFLLGVSMGVLAHGAPFG